MTRFAVFVEFRVEAGNHHRFKDVVLENAATSLRNEPGCRQFDVLTPEDGDGAGEFSLYEIYDSAQAFDAHLATEHYRQFEASVAPFVLAKKVRRFSHVERSVKP